MQRTFLALAAAIITATVATSSRVSAQQRGWVADVSIGYAGLVDDVTKGHLLFGGGIRRQVSPRVSLGPEFTLTFADRGVRDRNVMITGNVVADLVRDLGGRPVTPFVVAGAGVFFGRDQVRGGAFWSREPAFTGGAGVRIRAGDHVAALAQYRVGWELHHQLTAGAAIRW